MDNVSSNCKDVGTTDHSGLNTPRKIGGFIVTFEFRGQDMLFFVQNEDDIIQNHHAKGRFYEEDELNVISEYFSAGGVFVDIGANVGNHAIFVSRFLHAREIIVFEPNPAAIAVLKINIALNRRNGRVDTSFLGMGLSDKWVHADIVTPSKNLGGAYLRVAGGQRQVRVVPGDSLLSGRHIDFLKIDVEGMEIDVLNGLKQTISEYRPKIFIEVDNPNTEKFVEWARASQYHCVYTTKRQHWSLPPASMSGYENYLLVPAEHRR